MIVRLRTLSMNWGEDRVRELFKEEVKYLNEHAVIYPCSVVGSEGELYHTVTYI